MKISEQTILHQIKTSLKIPLNTEYVHVGYQTIGHEQLNKFRNKNYCSSRTDSGDVKKQLETDQEGSSAEVAGLLGLIFDFCLLRGGALRFKF